MPPPIPNTTSTSTAKRRRERRPPPPSPPVQLPLLPLSLLLLLLLAPLTTHAFLLQSPLPPPSSFHPHQHHHHHHHPSPHSLPLPLSSHHPHNNHNPPNTHTHTQPPHPPSSIPHHLALILDGNGRWAQQRGLPRGSGHKEGAQRAFDILQSCQTLGIKIVTLYCLSTENWSRPPLEVSIILSCIESSLRANIAYAHKNKIRLTVVGQMERLPASLQALVKQAEAETRAYEAMTVCLALSYGGRDDIVNAARTLAAKAATGEIQPQEIDESLFEAQLSTHRKGISHPPDLVIRTSGERRWSNFMLFECAYSEFFVSDILWPDFKEGDLLAALESYGQRNRRFGGVSVGVEEASSLIA